MAADNRIPLTSGALHVEATGDPRGPLVLCVHGLSANCRSFDRLAPALADAGNRVVAMDLRGRGRSDITAAGSYGWDSHVADLLEIADHFGADSFDLVGHSMGGFIGMALAAEHPERCRRLVLLDALGAPEPEALQSIAKSVGRLERTFASEAEALTTIRAAGTIVSWDVFWENYFSWELEPADGGGVRVRTALAAVGEDSMYAASQNLYELWPRLQCPVQLVRAGTPMAPDGGFVVSAADAERFAAAAGDANLTATVTEVDADHYSILTSPAAIGATERFVGVSARS